MAGKSVWEMSKKKNKPVKKWAETSNHYITSLKASRQTMIMSNIHVYSKNSGFYFTNPLRGGFLEM